MISATSKLDRALWGSPWELQALVNTLVLATSWEMNPFTLSITAYNAEAFKSNPSRHSHAQFLFTYSGMELLESTRIVLFFMDIISFLFHLHSSLAHINILPQVYVLSPWLKNCGIHTYTDKLNKTTPPPNHMLSSVWSFLITSQVLTRK